MFFVYLRRELSRRRKQTMVVAAGLAVAIALVIVVSSFSAGVRNAQASVLESVYGVGTDITVTQTVEPGADGPRRFEFGEDDPGASADGDTTQLAQSRLNLDMGSTAFDSTALADVQQIEHVTGAAATLSLQNQTFSGELPSQSDLQGTRPTPGDGSGGGFAGGSFGIDQFSVTGVDPSADAVGPLTTVQVAAGRSLAEDDADADVAVLDAQYASQASLGVGDTITVGGTDMEIVGTVSSTTGEGVTTGSDVYLPLAVAQGLSGQDSKVTDLYVSVDSAANVDAVAEAVQDALPDTSVSTQADLASEVTGTLSTAADLVKNLGTWLSAAVLVAAFGLAVLFTVSGVNRRTRELGTLKALGWSQRRVVGQVVGESVVQGLLGGAAGLALGAIAVLGINLAGITLAGSTGGSGLPDMGGSTGGPFGGRGPMDQAAQTAVDVVLHAPVGIGIALTAVGLAVLGGVVAGVVGGGRAARLRPAEALRSLA